MEELRKCKYCGKAFLVENPNQQYCCAEHQKICYEDNRRKKKPRKQKRTVHLTIDDYIKYCQEYGNISYGEWQTKVLRGIHY